MFARLKCLTLVFCVLSKSQVWNHSENKRSVVEIIHNIKTKNNLQSASATVWFDSRTPLSAISLSKVSLGFFASKGWCDLKD